MSASTMVEVTLSTRELAHLFSAMDDDEQALFFVEVAKAMHEWPAHAREMQAMFIGHHLRDCECATAEARWLIDAIAEAMHETATSDGGKGTR